MPSPEYARPHSRQVALDPEAERLAVAFTAGRMDAAEYADRLAAHYAAPASAGLRPRPRGGGRRMPEALRILWSLLAVGVAVNIAVYLILLFTEHRHVYPWPLWVAGPAGASADG
jgi:hypothetical protein